MASNAFLIALLIAAVAVPSLGTDYIVGDEAGWRLGVDYSIWAKDKMFFVGDRLIFMYNEGSHNVLKVDGPGFQQCAKSNTTGVLTSGNDVITLAKPGKKWYICSIDNHCNSGMKLVITVWEPVAPTPPIEVPAVPASEPIPALELEPVPAPSPAPAPAPNGWSCYNARIFKRL